MEVISYPQLGEKLYVETLPNGLQVTLLPKADFHKTYGLFTTNYGSIDNEFIPLGKTEYRVVPDGIAHFLEHKLFEKEEGDVFQVFSQNGASANAFTSFSRTSYLFSCTTQLKKNLTTLLDFVQAPYFTEETVNKEKGIIGQEIQMYQDDADWRLLFGLLGNLYPNHPVHIDIAGTIESIAAITAEDLYQSYRTFYQPSNMNLLVVGHLEPVATMDLIRDNQAQKDFPQPTPIQRKIPALVPGEVCSEKSEYMAVSRPKVLLGVRGTTALPTDERALLKHQVTGNLLVELLFGDTSQTQLELYNAGLIDDSFSAEYTVERGFHFIDVGGDTTEPEKLSTRLRELLEIGADSTELTDENLTLLKKKKIGKHLQSLNSLEYIANQFSQLPTGRVTLFDLSELINEITLEEVKACARELLVPTEMSLFCLYPKESDDEGE